VKSLNGIVFRVVGNLVALAGLAVLVSCGTSSSSSNGTQPSPTVSVSFNPTAITEPGNVAGTVTISPAAGSGGASVGLQVTAGSGTLSASQVMIGQGGTSTGFTLTVNPVTTTTNVEVTATYGATSGKGSVAVSPLGGTGLTNLQLNPSASAGDGTVAGTVILGSAAPAGGSTVNLSSSNSGAAAVPPTVTVPQGNTQMGFTITIKAVGGAQDITITATLGSITIPKTLHLDPITANFVVAPDSGTGANPPLQCAVTNSNDSNFPNLLQCTFDGSSSLPTTGISNFQWKLPGLTNSINQASPQLQHPKVGCGAGLNTVNVQLPVTLTVTAPGGTSNPKTQMVLFTKAGPC